MLPSQMPKPAEDVAPNGLTNDEADGVVISNDERYAVHVSILNIGSLNRLGTWTAGESRG